MTSKPLPVSKEKLQEILNKYPTPFHLYDERAIRKNAQLLLERFSWNQGFKQFFAVKATPNPFILKILKKVGFGADCSSLPELDLAEIAGITGSDMMFSSNDTPAKEYLRASELGATINLDDISHVPFLEEHCGIPELVSVRYNPGRARQGSFVMGSPEQAKYGFTRAQVLEGLDQLRAKGAKRFGVHTFIASNELNPQYFVDTAEMMFALALEVLEKVGIRIEFVNISGGVGIPYKPDEPTVDLDYVSEGIRSVYDDMIRPSELHPVALFTEMGRAITGPYGCLVSKVLHIKDIYKKHVGLDASMADLMRPAIYGAYHHITVVGKEDAPLDHVYDVTGSLCEPRDRFAVDRNLPKVELGDIIVIHDTGAHGHSMGFNYNGKLRSAELLLRETGEVIEIRRAETEQDYFATLDFQKLRSFCP
jgi:diaminopimelate decarboxylase